MKFLYNAMKLIHINLCICWADDFFQGLDTRSADSEKFCLSIKELKFMNFAALNPPLALIKK